MIERLVYLMRQRKFVWAILLLSIAFNILCVSLWTGAILGNKLPMLFLARSHFNEILGALPESRREEIRTIAKGEILPQLQRSIKDQVVLRQRLADLIEQPELSHQQLEQAFLHIRQLTGQSQAELQRHFIHIIMSLTPEERVLLAQGLRKSLHSAGSRYDIQDK